jgi:cytoskeletal protein CcmA (bactofilin family)
MNTLTITTKDLNEKNELLGDLINLNGSIQIECDIIVRGDIKAKGSIKAWDIKAEGSIQAWDITARDIKAEGDIKAWDIKATTVYSENKISALNIYTSGNIHANSYIKVKDDIYTFGGIEAGLIKAGGDVQCKSIIGDHSIGGLLDLLT